MESKNKIRKRQIKILQELNNTKKQKQTELIIKNLINSSIYQNSQKIAVFYSTEIEISTHELIKYSASKKEIYLPSIQENHHLKFLRYKVDEPMKQVQGIMEPTSLEEIETKDLDLIVVPGLTFSQNSKFRLGFGGGYYDRILSNYSGITASLVLDEQLVIKPTWPIESFDIPIKYLITSNKIL